MENKFLLAIGRQIALVICLAGGAAGMIASMLQAYTPTPEALLFRFAVVFICSLAAGNSSFVVGRVLCLLVLRVPIRQILLGAPALIRLHLGQTQVELGLPFARGAVRSGPVASRRRAALIHASGPLGNLVAAGILASIPAARPYGTGIALMLGAYGVMNFVPFRTKEGKLSAGYALIALAVLGRAEANLRRLTAEPGWPERPELLKYLLAKRDAAGYTTLLIKRLQRENRTGELAEWHARLWGHAEPLLPDMNARAKQRLAFILHGATDGLLNSPDVTRSAAEHGEKYLRWAGPRLPEECDPAAAHTLAVAYLRQGRFDEVEPLCTPLLSGDLMSEHRATVLATIVLARSALGEESQHLLKEAVALAPDADLVGEASAAVGEAPANAGNAGA